jgi:hypothetical protein
VDVLPLHLPRDHLYLKRLRAYLSRSYLNKRGMGLMRKKKVDGEVANGAFCPRKVGGFFLPQIDEGGLAGCYHGWLPNDGTRNRNEVESRYYALPPSRHSPPSRQSHLSRIITHRHSPWIQTPASVGLCLCMQATMPARPSSRHSNKT